MRKRFYYFIILALLIIVFPFTVSAHSGRTDSNGGHHDYKNKSGLGDYHYHHGMGPHLHPGGVCPYDQSAEADTYTPPAPSITIKNPPEKLNVGDIVGLEYTIENATSSASSISSDDETVIHVNADDTLTAMGEGTATITVSGSGITKTFTVTVKAVPVSSLKIEDAPEKIQLDSSANLKYTISPDNATDKTVRWSSSNTDIIEIDNDGIISAKNVGKSTITCKAANGIKAKVTINVYEVFPEEIEINCNDIKLECNKTQKVSVTILPENANNKNYTIKVNDNGIAKITDNTIQALNDGTTELEIVTDNGIRKSVPIEVYHIPVESIQIDDSNLDYTMAAFFDNAIDENDEIVLSASIEPSDATYQEMHWQSSNPDVVAIVDNNFVIKGTGNVILTVQGHDSVEESIELQVVNQNMIAGLISICAVGCGGVGTLIYRKKKICR